MMDATLGLILGALMIGFGLGILAAVITYRVGLDL